ncbi:MAG: hypothetical protein QGI32_25975, partial [Candidatus Latescibacteria bacterium]|nr:hypothetical protein [Candidatus Latescibacterota bacterium]
FMSGIEDEATVQLISACAMQGLDQEQVEQQWQDHLLRFKRDALTHRIDLSRQALQAAAKAGDAEEIARVNAALAALIKERQGLEQPGAS